MKHFEFAGLRFSVGNGIKNFEIDITINQYKKYCEVRGIEFSKNICSGIGVNMIPICIEKIQSNNWRKNTVLKCLEEGGVKNNG